MGVLETERLGPLFSVAMCMALRPSEAIGLRWADVDLDRRDIRIEQRIPYKDGEYDVRVPKTELCRRALPLPSAMVSVLQRHRIRQLEERVAASREWVDSGLVFTNLTGGPVYAAYVNRKLQRILEREGPPRIVSEQLRHTGATLLLALGESIEVVQEFLGHTSINTTRRYARVIEPLKRRAADRMDEFLSRGV